MARAHEDLPTDSVETIKGYAISPWQQRIPAIIDRDSERAVEVANCTSGICIATSSAERKGMVGMVGAIYDTYGRMPSGQPTTFAVALGPRTEQNPYVAELEAIAMAVRRLPPYLMGREITVFTSNQAAIQVINQPKHQSGQNSITRVYEEDRRLRDRGNRVLLRWVPAHEFQLGIEAKKAVRRATRPSKQPHKQFSSAKSTIINKGERRGEKAGCSQKRWGNT
jgi:ribonuclease HI